jgi:hypothetical protein
VNLYEVAKTRLPFTRGIKGERWCGRWVELICSDGPFEPHLWSVYQNTALSGYWDPSFSDFTAEDYEPWPIEDLVVTKIADKFCGEYLGKFSHLESKAASGLFTSDVKLSYFQEYVVTKEGNEFIRDFGIRVCPMAAFKREVVK